MSELENEFSTEVVEAEAPAPRTIILDKRLVEALEIVGVRVHEST